MRSPVKPENEEKAHARGKGRKRNTIWVTRGLQKEKSSGRSPIGGKKRDSVKKQRGGWQTPKIRTLNTKDPCP